jgi:N-methylhydantoinase A/oxoprolinase/acetone carboxylase beta subunit
VEIVGYRLIAVAASPLRAIRSASARRGGAASRAEGYYARYELEAEARLEGPCVVEEPTATTYVPDGWTAHTDRLANLILEARR